MAKVDPKVVNIWTARVVPLVLMCVVGYATYVHVARLCVDYLLNSPPQRRRAGPATALLVIYFVLMLPMSLAFFRLLYIVLFDPGFVPLGRRAGERENEVNPNRRRKVEARDDGVGGRRYEAPEKKDNWHVDADAPGLEEFYTRDVFVCEMDGRPKWCAECACWKPDRAHHCSDVGRCVRRMDHFCPWVGGVVGENSYKFFFQFVFYTATYCFYLLAVMAYYLHEQIITPDITYDPQFAAIIGLAAFFGLFTFGMTCSAGHFTLTNLTTIENLSKRTKVWQLAVHISDRQISSARGITGAPFATVTYPLPIISEKPRTSPAPSDTTNEEAIETENHHTDLAHLAERDAKAKRTFAILQMEPGQNPWNLGAVENWKSVMGTNVLDWFLPIRRSPLCNHESAIGQFKLGKDFDKLMADTGLLSGNSRLDARPSSSRKKSRRHSYRGSASRRDVEMQVHHQLAP